jgi:hypothetical protein
MRAAFFQVFLVKVVLAIHPLRFCRSRYPTWVIVNQNRSQGRVSLAHHS